MNQAIRLATDDKLFYIPENVLVIGTMNTADRSIALVDHALRRRFAFIRLDPNYTVLENYHQGNGFPVDKLVEVLRSLNQRIDNPDYAIGISFFLQDNLDAHLEDIWRMEIEPYLEEYFFDRTDYADSFRWDKIRERILL